MPKTFLSETPPWRKSENFVESKEENRSFSLSATLRRKARRWAGNTDERARYTGGLSVKGVGSSGRGDRPRFEEVSIDAKPLTDGALAVWVCDHPSAEPDF